MAVEFRGKRLAVGRPRVPMAMGQRFTKLVVGQETDHRSDRGEVLYECHCDCGQTALVCGSSLRNGKTQSCGCYRRAQQVRSGTMRRVHGHYRNELAKDGGTPTYRSWQAMLQRCHYPKHVAYARYGGNGVSVTKPWRDSFQSFLNDMGDRPEGKSIDRIDNRFGYFMANCRWATRKEQYANRGVKHA